jgi:hypothetical protein
MRSRDGSYMKVDGPSAEEPVVDPVLHEQAVDDAKRSELLLLVQSGEMLWLKRKRLSGS